MDQHMKIRKADGVWSVRSGGAVLGESSQALELSEGDYPFVIYFPREDIAVEMLDRTDHTTTCPHKGTASYFSIVTKSTTLENAVWSYENPTEGAARIKDHLAFHVGPNVTVEQI